jgi:hypothetical protein
MANRYIDPLTQQQYLREITRRNKIEIDQCAQFIKDYGFAQRELKDLKKEIGRLKSERSKGAGDQSELREAREENDRLKALLGAKDLGKATS